MWMTKCWPLFHWSWPCFKPQTCFSWTTSFIWYFRSCQQSTMIHVFLLVLTLLPISRAAEALNWPFFDLDDKRIVSVIMPGESTAPCARKRIQHIDILARSQFFPHWKWVWKWVWKQIIFFSKSVRFLANILAKRKDTKNHDSNMKYEIRFWWKRGFLSWNWSL